MGRTRQLRASTGEEGYLLVGAIVAIFLVMLALSVAAPTVARQLQRDREVEAAHRANQYVRAIRLYYRKFGHYPGSIDQLKNSNNQKFLRQEYADPWTGKADWRLIHVGEAKTKVKGFFGEDLPGLPAAGSLGSAAGMSSNGFGATGATGTSTSSFGSSGTSTGIGTSGPGAGTSTFGSGSTSSFGNPGTSGTSGTGTGTGTGSGTGSGSGVSSQDATSFTGGGAPIMGIGLMKSGDSILVVNEQTNYADWEFLYDPRIEQLYAKGSLLGGPPSTGTSGLGTAPSTGIGGLNGPGAPATPTTGTTTPTTGTSNPSGTPQ